MITLKKPKMELENNKLHIFSDETILSLVEFGEVLRSIHNRLIKEGYTIKDGVITPPNKNDQ